jgi:hypothetical protein
MVPRPRIAAVALAVLLLIGPAAPTAAHARAGHCTILPQFADLRAAVGAGAVGACTEAARTTAEGDVRQRTTGGELVLRATDRRALFSDGTDTWVVGPHGVRRRPNGEHFFWETLAPAQGETLSLSAAAVGHQPADVRPGAILPAKRIVSYYGNPLSAQMGILGELDPEPMMARLREQVAAYQKADPAHQVVPALELVATVAQASAGRDGMYRLRMDTELIEEVAGWAERHGWLLILDVQVGRSTVEEEVKAMLPFLRRPYVHLALDPEFAMTKDQEPGKVIGSHSTDDVNVAIDILADLVEKEGLPPKLLLVHRFTEKMLTAPGAVGPGTPTGASIKDDPRVQVSIIMDGFGSPALKAGTYDQVVRDRAFKYRGFKLFYKQDVPLMTPEQVLELDPEMTVIIYQ